MLDVQPAATTDVNLANTEVVIPNNTDIANPPEGITINIEDDVAGMKTVEEVPKLLTDETVNNVAAEVPVETVTNTNSPFVPYNTAYVPPEGDDNDPVTPTFTETDDGVTVGLPVDTGGGTVAPALGVNVAGDPVMECPEGMSLWMHLTVLPVLRSRSRIDYERVQVLDHTLDRLYVLGTRAPDNEDNNMIEGPIRRLHLDELTSTTRRSVKRDLGLNRGQETHGFKGRGSRKLHAFCSSCV